MVGSFSVSIYFLYLLQCHFPQILWSRSAYINPLLDVGLPLLTTCFSVLSFSHSTSFGHSFDVVRLSGVRHVCKSSPCSGSPLQDPKIRGLTMFWPVYGIVCLLYPRFRPCASGKEATQDNFIRRTCLPCCLFWFIGLWLSRPDMPLFVWRSITWGSN